MSKLIEAIRRAANQNRADIVNYYVCEVIAQPDGTNYNSDDYTIICKIITGKGQDYIPNTDMIDGDGNIIQENPQLSYFNGGNILQNVQIMCGVDDGILLIPTIGSQVVVLTSTLQQPLCIQYSNIDQVIFSSNSNYNINIGSTSNYSNLELTEDTVQTSVISSSASNTTQIIQNSNQIEFVTPNGVTFKQDTKFGLATSSDSLFNLLNDTLSLLNTMIGINIPSGSSMEAVNPTVITTLNDLSTRLGNLLE